MENKCTSYNFRLFGNLRKLWKKNLACFLRHGVRVSQKNHPPPLRPAVFWHFSQTLENFKSIFTRLLHFPIYGRLQIFIQLSPTLTKLCHIKCDYLVHIICSKCPPSAETHAFRRLRKSLMALLIVVRGKSSQICCFYNVKLSTNMLDMTRRQQWRHLLSKQT